MNQSNTIKFIEKAIKLHGDKYDYSSVIYVNARQKVEIICKIHGVFFQIPNSHLVGSGCSKCGFIATKTKKTKTTEEFIKDAYHIHGDKYDYSVTNYTNNNKHVDIICKKHGIFKQKPIKHLSGNNCKKCIGDLLRSNTTIFISNCKNKYIDYNYDYTKTIYIDCFSDLIITCPKHGDFTTNSHNFLSKGRICKQCINRNSSIQERKWLDELNIPIENRNVYVKIGNKRFCVDGIDYKNNIIYEFYGDYYHGNPLVYKKDEINKRLNKTFGELFDLTINRENYIKENSNYSIINIWEKESKEKKIKTNKL